MSLWFAGTAVVPQLARIWNAGLGVSSWLTLAVQLGFVTGALLFSIFNISDIFPAPRVVAASGAVAALLNVAFAYVAARHITAAIIFRFFTGFAIAGVYPPGMKILAGWFRSGRGASLGIFVGALCIGSATPYGINALGGVGEGSWRAVIYTSSAFAAAGAMLVAIFVKEGPYAAPSPPFDWRQVTDILSFRNRPLGLANLGYLGHMWELYSMWTWLALMLRESAQATGGVTMNVKALTFFAIAVGFFGCWWAGRASDRIAPQELSSSSAALLQEHDRIRRRSLVTIVAMSVSGICCLLTAIFFRHFYVVACIALVWGISVIADSAQFSAIISEVADPRYLGTALTMQTAMGFLLTVVSIRAMAAIGENFGWPLAAASLAIGPAVGIAAMLRLMKR